MELVWEGGFERELRGLTLVLKAESSAQVRIMPYVFQGERFDRVGNWQSVPPNEKKPLTIRLKGKNFGGFKLVSHGGDLPGKRVTLKDVRLSSVLYEGHFRKEVVVPEGRIWEAVAEVGNMATLWINGQRADDKTVVLPRPHQAARTGHPSAVRPSGRAGSARTPGRCSR